MLECLISYILKYINNNDKEKNRVHRFLERSWYNIGNDESYDKLFIFDSSLWRFHTSVFCGFRINQFYNRYYRKFIKKKSRAAFISILLLWNFYSAIILFISLDENVFQNIIGLLYARCRILKDSIGEQSISIGLLSREVAPLWFLPAMFIAYISLFLTKKWGANYNGFNYNFCMFISFCLAVVM